MTFYAQEQIATHIWSTNVDDLGITHPVIVFTRDPGQLVTDLPYRVLTGMSAARAEADRLRAEGHDVRWKDRLRVLIAGQAEKAQVWNAVHHAWFAHHIIVVNQKAAITPLVLDAARHYKVPFVIFSHVVGGQLKTFCVLSADKIVSFGETTEAHTARQFTDKLVHIL